ncbi:hypothetical protein CKA32_005769 [Geitlerinema sp. FC II]|nr:hypothetical protein CKA32_005769 [Geitlerinema sp. FC II]
MDSIYASSLQLKNVARGSSSSDRRLELTFRTEILGLRFHVKETVWF